MKKILLLCGLSLMFATTTINAQQTWQIGSPNVADVIATLNNNTLTISGTGNMMDWGSDPRDVPWYDLRNVIETVIIESGVTSIGGSAFNNHVSIVSVSIGSSVVSIGQYAFYYSQSLATVFIPNNVTSIGYRAFGDSWRLTSIQVGTNNPNYSSIDGVLFNKDQTTLIKYPAGKRGAYTIPNSVTTLERAAFASSFITSVRIPNSVTSIEHSAFAGCVSLDLIVVEWITPLNIEPEVFIGVQTNLVRLNVPIEAEEAYRNADVWENFIINVDYERLVALLQDSIGRLNNEIETLLNNISALQNDTIKLQDSIRKLWLLLNECRNSGTSNAAFILQNQIQFYPNPVINELRITIDELQIGEIVELFDMIGRRVFSERLNYHVGEFTIDMSAFQFGNYILRIGNRVAKVVKQ